MDRLLRMGFEKLIRVGNLRVSTAGGSTFTFGDGTGRPVTIRFTTRAAEGRVLIDPEQTTIVEAVFPRRNEESLIKEKKFFFLVLAKYRDIFDIDHVIKACFEIVPPIWSGRGTQADLDALIDRFDLEAQMCRKNNCTDNDCPNEDR
jgi:hypothetical protein